MITLSRTFGEVELQIAIANCVLSRAEADALSGET
jgi:hypothetical protein